MKQDNSQTLIILAVVGFLAFIFYQENNKDNVNPPSPQRDKVAVKIATEAGRDYILSVSSAFKDVGQRCLNGDFTSATEVHSELTDLNDTALDKYEKINELLQSTDQSNLDALGKLCIEIGEGLGKVVK